ncbi:hypothetical protein GCK72_020962 [Caenorhabditis remanei]|uniref:Uncharacterized protein n=1 Tax=Caenorhabditis remanei TaxID=31234 RepID=A0A6A5GIH8_CAERE|nr:hypothetical protein GCK72_020962 [Caenorhabditis remanei]KAF1754401.1 hypothetical protein GCK72_020962 [Caenorhabditis remanei]
MTYCSAGDQFSYFNSVEFNSLGYHILGAIAIPFHILGAYCIIFKTPQTMSSVKWPMLNYHIITTLVDVMFGFMVCPYIIAPFSIMLPSGVLQILGVYQGVQAYLMITSVEIMAVSMVQIVENRYMILKNGNLRWQKIRIPWFCFNYSLASLATLPMYLEIPKDQESAKSDIFAKVPCIPRKIREDPAIFVVAENMNLTVAVILTFVILIAIQFLTFSRLSRLALKKSNTQLSEMTIKLQKKFLRAYVIQIASYHILGAIAMPFHILGAYCIIFKTPQTMSSVKWSMLNYHIITTLVDVMFGFMVCPYVIAPFSIMLPSGVLQILGVYQGVQVYLWMMSIAIMGVSMVQVVENRYMILSNGNPYWQKIRIPCFCFNYSLASLATLPMYLEIPKNQESAKSDIFAVIKRDVTEKFEDKFFQELPCLPREIREDPALFVFAENMNLTIVAILTLAVLIDFQFSTFARLSRRALKTNGTQLSEMTIKLQKKFLRALIIQIGCPFIFMVLPLSMILFEYFSTYFNQTLNNTAFLMLASYGLSSTMIMLLVHSPYRIFLKEQLSELLGVRKMARNQTFNVVIPSVASIKSRINLI